jgi:cbb3-type cytochrome oxidase subunit 3
MIQNVLRNLGGIEVYGILSILIFFACFLGVLVWTFTRSQAELDAASRLPLEEDSAPFNGTAASSKPDCCHE